MCNLAATSQAQERVQQSGAVRLGEALALVRARAGTHAGPRKRKRISR